MGVYRLQHESLRSMWSSGPSGRSIFPAAFEENLITIYRPKLRRSKESNNCL